MKANSKILVVAVVATSFWLATLSSAQAEPFWFNSDAAAGAKTTLKGEQKERAEGAHDEFTTTAGVVKCTATTYTGSMTGPTATSVKLTPVYGTAATPCTAFGFPATVTATGCSYVLHTGVLTSAGTFPTTATLDCEAGKTLTVVAAISGVTKCTVRVKGQDIGTVNLTQATKASGRKDIHADIELSGIHYTETAGTGAGACATTGSPEPESGTYKGTATLSGFNSAGAETDIAFEELPVTEEPFWFNSDAAAGAKTTLKGEQKERGAGVLDEFSTTAGIVKCSSISYSGSVSGPTQTSITLHPELTKCSGLIGSTRVSTEGCNYIFEVGLKLASVFASTGKIECEAGVEITLITEIAGVRKCTIDVPPQDLGLVEFTNATRASGVKDIHADLSFEVSYKETAGTGAGACATSSLQSGSYSGTATLVGVNPGGSETSILLK